MYFVDSKSTIYQRREKNETDHMNSILKRRALFPIKNIYANIYVYKYARTYCPMVTGSPKAREKYTHTTRLVHLSKLKKLIFLQKSS